MKKIIYNGVDVIPLSLVGRAEIFAFNELILIKTEDVYRYDSKDRKILKCLNVKNGIFEYVHEDEYVRALDSTLILDPILPEKNEEENNND